MIRNYMPEQHRVFYVSLEYIFVCVKDEKGWPRAVALTGPAGFIQSPTPTELTISLNQAHHAGRRLCFGGLQSVPTSSRCLKGCKCTEQEEIAFLSACMLSTPGLGDAKLSVSVLVLCLRLLLPVCNTWLLSYYSRDSLQRPLVYTAEFTAGKSIGLLGLEMHTRCRNRANGNIIKAEQGCLYIHVTESYGNCPKYIQVCTTLLTHSGLLRHCLFAIQCTPCKSSI